MSVVPGTFLFRYKFALLKNSRIPPRGKGKLNLSADYLLPAITVLNGNVPFAELRMAWNVKGIGLSMHVTGKQHPPVANLVQPEQSDLLQVWFDTRDTQSIHRASQYCHHFSLFPSGETNQKKQLMVAQHQIPNAKADAPDAELSSIQVTTTIQKQGYLLEVWFPAETLHGFAPERTPRLGFFYHLHDTELGDQFLTVDQKFPVAQDPSLWSTLELSKG